MYPAGTFYNRARLTPMYVRIALNIPSDKVFSYSVSDRFIPYIAVGMRVLVPFGKRRMTGYVVELCDEKDRDDIKDIIDILDVEPLFSERDLTFYQWVSDYYIHPLGKTLRSILPGGIDIESNRWICLSRENNHIERAPLSSGQREITDMLTRHPVGISLKKLQQEVNRINIYDDIKKLTALGLISTEDRLRKPDVKRKTEKIVSLTGNHRQNLRLTGKQQMITDLLLERGTMTLTSLNENITYASAVIRRLEKKGVVVVQSREVYRNPHETYDLGAHEKPKTLTDEQATALSEIMGGLTSRRYAPYLLHGVTGSGKTEIYFCAIEEILRSGGSVILLVPEIALTPQLLSRVKKRFDKNDTAILHSGISQSEKFDEWRRIMKGDARIVIGVRSAVFAPTRNLRLIIVDEEHDPSYKQDDRITYNARNLAIVKAKLNAAAIILGSATPEIQTTFNALERDFTYISLTKRVDDRPLPHIDVIDMKTEKDNKGKVPILSRPLKAAIQEALAAGKQTLLFLNRRGYTTFLYCHDCGYIFKCPNCSVSMTHHMSEKVLRCHYCDHTLKAPPMCSQCKGYRISNYGIGTEKVESHIKDLYPKARVERMDSDTTQRKGSYGRILMSLNHGHIDILIGTQMITKGHDYPNVTLVGVLSADTSLNIPDFRASERTFQLITQVSGRGGRGDTPGKVIVQTFNPNHYAIRRACHHDCQGFYSDEIAQRRYFGYPPFSRMVNFRISSLQKDAAKYCARTLKAVAQKLVHNESATDKIRIMGPAEAPIARIKGKYRWHMLLMGNNIRELQKLAREILAETKKLEATIKVDVDPVNFM
ncbi:MAG TPA: primosomal protein N' [Deltaproteobacteria bacterium]|nr:primosomal protein N' [Deltaproteobacteria bacterium]